MLAVVLLVLSIVPCEVVVHDRVEMAELNHFYDERGRLVFDQVIFWDWCDQASDYVVRDWRLQKKLTQIPTPHANQYRATWHDAHSGGLLRTVSARQYRETWTQNDPELANREQLPRERRRELLVPKLSR